MSKFVTQIVSDLHLSSAKRIIPRAPNLILAGDISSKDYVLYGFLSKCSQDFDQVYLVPGNHEYYDKDYEDDIFGGITFIQEQDQLIEWICEDFPNVVYLQKKVVTLEKSLKLLGCTLWTPLPKSFQFQSEVSDFKRMPYFDPEIRNIYHANHRFWLEKKLEKIPRFCNKILITHHPPFFSGVFQKQFSGHPLSCCFAASHMEGFFPKVDTWIYGHTHCTMDTKRDQGIFPRFISNPKGFLGDETDYQPEKIFVL